MTSCCSAEGGEAESASACPRCGQAGRSVERITLKAILTPVALPRLSSEPYRFCPTPDCAIVYFGPETVFVLDDLTAPVFQKQRQAERTVCYCFDVKDSDLRREVAASGRSESAARIATLVK